MQCASDVSVPAAFAGVFAWSRLRFWVSSVDGSGLLRLRIGLGLLVAVSAVRLFAYGWVDTLYVEPSFHFSYDGWSWIRSLPAPWMHVWVGSLIPLGMAVGMGWGGRAILVLTFFIFTYIELIDRATYLNHYYLVSVLLLHLALSSASTLRMRDRFRQVPRFELWAVRAQVSLVYFFAGLWKLNGDWLFRAEPLSTWLWSFSATPVIGVALASPPVAYAMSWAGALFDLTIWILLLWRPTSRAAFIVCVGFHFTLWWMFPIGIFSAVMVLAASTLLPTASSPASVAREGSEGPSASVRVRAALVAILIATQILVPLRSVVEDGEVNWHERGYRFAWRVMLNEKASNAAFDVRVDGQRQEWNVLQHLTPLQRRQMGFQPDMLLQYAHFLCQTFSADGSVVDVRVRADVAWNRRRAAPLIADENLCIASSAQAITLPASPR